MDGGGEVFGAEGGSLGLDGGGNVVDGEVGGGGREVDGTGVFDEGVVVVVDSYGEVLAGVDGRGKGERGEVEEE